MSDISTLCSNNTNEKEEAKCNNTFSPINNKNILLFQSFFKNDSEKVIKKYNSTSKIKQNIHPCDIDIKNYLKIVISKKINIANTKDDIQYNHLNKCKINIKNRLNPINNNNLNHNKISNKKCITRKKIKKVDIKQNDYYTQNKDISCMSKDIPKIPNLFNHKFSLQNENTSNNYNKTFGELNKEIIPICFYNHLMFNDNDNYNNIICNKKKLFKASLTQRNKNKLLTIIYYSPKTNKL